MPASNPKKTRDIRLGVVIKAKPEQVYKALTSARELCRWWLSGAETDARSSGRVRLVWPALKSAAGGRAFPPHAAFGEIEGHFVDLEPGRKVAWLWRLPRRKTLFPPLSSFFILPKGRGSAVCLLHAGFSASPSADRFYDGCSQGWEDCLAKLRLYLESGRTAKTQVLTLKRNRPASI